MWSKIRKKATIKRLVSIAAFLVATFLLGYFSMSEMLIPLMLITLSIISFITGWKLIKNATHFKLLIAFCIGIASYAISLISAVLPQPLKFAHFFVLPVAGGFFVVVVGMISRLLTKSQTLQSISVIVKLFSMSWINFFFGFFLTVYIAFIRPPLLESIPVGVIGEWIVIVFGISVVYMEIKRETLDFYAEPKFSEWKKHVKIVERRTNTDFDYLASIQDSFVNSGEKELMLTYYALQLKEKGESERDILRKIRQWLGQYQEKKMPLLAFPWTKKKIQRDNKKIREELLKKLVEEIT